MLSRKMITDCMVAHTGNFNPLAQRQVSPDYSISSYSRRRPPIFDGSLFRTRERDTPDAIRS